MRQSAPILFVIVSSLANAGPKYAEHNAEQQDRSAQDITISSPVDGFSCSVNGEGAVALKTQGAELRLSCTSPNYFVSCDGIDLEPVDFKLVDACRTQRVQLKAGRRALLSGLTEPAQVEWIQWTVPSRIDAVARRGIEPNVVSHIYVAPEANRFVRVLRSGLAPVTIAARDLFERTVFVVPNSAPGGEIIARIEPSSVKPDSYRLTDGSVASHLLEAHGSFLSARGVAPGQYSIVPEYKGGIRGNGAPIYVHAGQTTFTEVKREPVGAVVVTIPSDQCISGLMMRLTRISKGAIPVRMQRMDLSETGLCTWEGGGLAPGTFEATATNSQGSVGSVIISVTDNEIATATLSLSNVTVAGRVTLNGTAIAGAVLTWSRQFGAGFVQSTTSFDGSYIVSLDAPGEYVVTMLTDERASRLARLRVKPGENTFDWSLTGGTLTVAVVGWNRGGVLTVEVLSDRSKRSTVVNVEDRLPIVLRGTMLGTYAVTARTEDGYTSGRPVVVSLTSTSSDAMVVLKLVPPK